MKAPDDVNYGCGSPTSCFGLTSNALPKEKQSHLGNCSQTGVPYFYVPIDNHQWFVFRFTYNRVENIIETLKKNLVYVYIPNFVLVYSIQNHLEELFCEENYLNHLRFYRNRTKDVCLLE